MTFEEFLEDNGVECGTEGNKHCHYGWINFDCPYCSPDTGYWRMGYNLERAYCYCWVCAYHRLDNVISKIRGTRHGTAGIIDHLDMPFPDAKQKHLNRKPFQRPSFVNAMGRIHRHYLLERGIDPKKASILWALRGIGANAPKRLAWRIYIPIYYEGMEISYTARSVADNCADADRYRTAEIDEETIPHKQVLFGEDLVTGSTIAVLEGPLDVVKVGPPCVATFGLGYSREQLLRIGRYPRRFICMDNQSHAQERARQMVDELSVFPGETFNVVLDSGKDPGDISKKELNQFRRLLK